MTYMTFGGVTVDEEDRRQKDERIERLSKKYMLTLNIKLNYGMVKSKYAPDSMVNKERLKRHLLEINSARIKKDTKLYTAQIQRANRNNMRRITHPNGKKRSSLLGTLLRR